MPDRIFLLSPASCGGKRAELLFDGAGRSDLARRLRTPQGAPIGEVFTFVSSLYFRGKLTYASHFARPPAKVPGVLVITPTLGLVPPERSVTLETLRTFRGVDIASGDARYRAPVEADAQVLAQAMGSSSELVLLGSVATGKYLDVLRGIFGLRLRFPRDFVGRGDMSRGGLLLRSVREGRELEYVPIEGATLRGVRPPKLAPRRA